MEDKGDSFLGIVALIIGIAIGYFIIGVIFGDINLSIPTKPETKDAIVADLNTLYFNVIYDENFSGYIKLVEGNKEAYCTIKNIGKNVVKFNDLSHFLLWTIDGKSYSLKTLYNLTPQDISDGMLNPNQRISFSLELPNYLPQTREIEGFNIWVNNSRAIRFGYYKLGLIDRIRWWIAKEIRN